MEAYEMLQLYRNDADKSISQICEETGISKSAYCGYEHNRLSIYSMNVKSCIKLFEALGRIDTLPDFFNQTFGIKVKVANSIEAFRNKKPRELSFIELNRKTHSKVYQISSRGKKKDDFNKDKWLSLLDAYKAVFDRLSGFVDENGYISNDVFESVYLPFNYLVRSFEKNIDFNSVSGRIEDALYHTEYSISDLCEIVSVSRRHFNDCKSQSQKESFGKMHIGTALEISEVLSKDFFELFYPGRKPVLD